MNDGRYPTMEHTKRTFWGATKSILEMIWYVPQIVFWVIFDYIRLKKKKAVKKVAKKAPAKKIAKPKKKTT